MALVAALSVKTVKTNHVTAGLEKPSFFRKKVFRFLGLMYKDRTQNYDTEIHEEYLIHDTPISLPHHFSHVQTI